jgi:hypothetical protein
MCISLNVFRTVKLLCCCTEHVVDLLECLYILEVKFSLLSQVLSLCVPLCDSALKICVL